MAALKDVLERLTALDHQALGGKVRGDVHEVVVLLVRFDIVFEEGRRLWKAGPVIFGLILLDPKFEICALRPRRRMPCFLHSWSITIA